MQPLPTLGSALPKVKATHSESSRNHVVPHSSPFHSSTPLPEADKGWVLGTDQQTQHTGALSPPPTFGHVSIRLSSSQLPKSLHESI